jgi:hypothetical protein
MIAPLASIGIPIGLNLINQVLGSSDSQKTQSFDQLLNQKQKINWNEMANQLRDSQVVVQGQDGKMIVGTVQGVQLQSNGLTVRVNGQKYDFSQIKQIIKEG